MTVVEAGEEIRDKYPVGSRYIIQADIYVNGINVAYGYALDGGMAQYSLIDQRVLDGDEGSYLLPLADSIPAALAALIEPWTCVIASYMIEHRTTPKPGGRMLVAMDPNHEQGYTLTTNLPEKAPTVIDCLNVNGATCAALAKAFPGTPLAMYQKIPSETRYDDLVLCGIQNRQLGENLGKIGTANALISYVGDIPAEEWAMDVGSIHYKGWFYQGTAGTEIGAAYGRNVRTKLKKGGTCWLPGGAGAMGQMHTQLAVENADGPSRILVTDLDSTRIAKMQHLLEPKIKERGIEFKTLNPKDFSSEAAFMDAVKAFAPAGFDDIVMLVPVPQVVNSSSAFLGPDGLMNIFAGIPAGKEALLNVARIAHDGVRYIGSSGSRTAHLRHTLEMVETGALNPATALAAIGGMGALWDGLNGVAEARFPGKTVIFPNCETMPLTAVENLAGLIPGIDQTLTPGGFYSMTTESALLKQFGGKA